jgi:hypothetical protein
MKRGSRRGEQSSRVISFSYILLDPRLHRRPFWLRIERQRAAPGGRRNHPSLAPVRFPPDKVPDNAVRDDASGRSGFRTAAQRV